MFESTRALASTQTILIGATAVPLIATGAYLIFRFTRRPKDREQMRRLAVNLEGRLGDALITDVRDDVVFYSYSIGGVVYTASQDISQLRDHILSDPTRLIGPVSLKYSPRNPANSIIICERWSGLRSKQPPTRLRQAEV